MTPARMAAIHAATFVQPRPWSEAEFSALLASDHVFTLTEPEGFVIGRAVAGEAELLTLAVDPAHWGRGCGRRLVQAFLDECARRQSESVFLEVAESNRRAQALYTRLGFALQGRRKAYYRGEGLPPQDALILVFAR